jgi:hypothetical protein
LIPSRESPLHRLPIWIKIAVPLTLLLLGLLTVAVLRVLQEEIPPHAQVPGIQERFPQQIAFLAMLADEFPVEGCADDPEEMVEEIRQLERWWARAEAGDDVLSHPAVMGAEVMRYCGDRELGYSVKESTGPQGAWSPAMLFPPDEYPAVSLWHLGAHRLVRYEHRMPQPEGITRGYRLTLDLERIDPGPGPVSADALPGGDTSD